jgi:hypothetical protein
MQSVVDFEPIDLYDRIAALDPAYVDAANYPDPYAARVNYVYYSEADRSLYVVFGDGYVFTSRDSLATLTEVTSLNYQAGSLVPPGRQSVDAVTDTLDGTVLLVGRDRRERAGTEAGVAWRRQRGAGAFVRSVVTDPAWMTSRSGNLTAGFIGAGRTKAVALAIYSDSDAHFYYSLDDGLTWRRQSMTDCFRLHVHQVYLPKSVNPDRSARLWVTGGDDPTGERSGVFCFDALGEDGSLGGLTQVLRETPGYRVVGLAGDGRHVFIGNESLAGGLIKIQDNRESIEARDFEYVLGKARHDYHQFRALLATPDGLLISGSSSYGYVGDSVRADSGGYLYISNNGGATFAEIPLGARWVGDIAYDGRSFYFTASAGRESGPDVTRDRFKVYRLRKPSPYAELATSYVCKAVILDSSRFYEHAGYEDHPRATLAPGERTPRVDMTGYREVALAVETLEAGRLIVEATPFYNWRLEETPWRDMMTLDFDGAAQREVLLPGVALHNKYLRVRNAGQDQVAIRYIAFTGKR